MRLFIVNQQFSYHINGEIREAHQILGVFDHEPHAKHFIETLPKEVGDNYWDHVMEDEDTGQQYVDGIDACDTQSANYYITYRNLNEHHPPLGRLLEGEPHKPKS